ncbi:MAG: SPOR domain-containing protein [Pseudomonadales bacterium]|nr:SPOR domain-containing protein [Pseudomonadales bacterium]NRA16023.1 SPOR domain-containing protein [Oceanospirillaceae bacterium]
MASRKDFAPKRRNTNHATRKKAMPKAPKMGNDNTASKTAAELPARRSPWKWIVASFMAISAISFLLIQLSQVDPRAIRESGISAIIMDNSDNSTIAEPNTNQSVTVSGTAAKQIIHSKTAKAAVSKVPVTEKSTLAQQKEPYQFYKILATENVATENIEAYKSTPKTAKLQYKTLLQTGSFRQQKDAQRMKAMLLLNNLPNVKVGKITSDNGTWYRVRTGPFITFAQLRAAGAKLNRLNISPMQVQLH